MTGKTTQQRNRFVTLQHKLPLCVVPVGQILWAANLTYEILIWAAQRLARSLASSVVSPSASATPIRRFL